MDGKQLHDQLRRAGVTFDQYDQAVYQGESTDPMERSEYSIGKGNDFFYMDFLMLPLGYVALELVIDAGSYTATQDYAIVPDDKAPDVAYMFGCSALDWFSDNGIYRVPGRAARNRFARDIKRAIAQRGLDADTLDLDPDTDQPGVDFHSNLSPRDFT